MYGPSPQLNPGPRLAAPGWYEDQKQRAAKHGEKVYDTLKSLNGREDLVTHWLYFVLKVLASVATVFLLVVLLMVSATSVWGDNSDSATYVTNTFYTSNDNENNITWQILTSNPWNGLPRPGVSTYNALNLNFEHYYECMWVAQEGWGLCNATGATVATYKTCLDSSYTSQLAQCTSFGDALTWPTANRYSNCINDKLNNGNLSSLNAFRTCIDVDLWPLYDTPQDVTTTFFLGSYSWPLLVITSTFLMFVFAVYTIWPVDWEDATLIEHGKPSSNFVRLGMAWSGIAILLAIAWLLFALLIAFRAGSTWPNNYVNLYPSTQQTNVAMVVTTLSVIFYFLFDASEYQERKQVTKGGYDRLTDGDERRRSAEDMDNQHGQNDREGWEASRMGFKIPVVATMEIKAPIKPGPLGYFFPENQAHYNVDSLDKAGEYYTPVLLKTWSDAYLLDPLFAVGMMGATLQVFTADVYNVFWCLLFYRIAHVGVARAIYYAYVQVHLKLMGKNGNVEREYANSDILKSEAVAATKVLALALHLAAICALLVPLYIAFDNTRMLVDYSLLFYMFILSYVIPETLRFFGHLILSFLPHENGKHYGLYILVIVQFIWTWDLIIRTVMLWLLLWSNGGNRGTKPYLVSGLQTIQTVLAL